MVDTSLRIPGSVVVAPTPARERVGEAVRRLTGAVSPAKTARYAWAGLWLPYWLGSDVPAPGVPSRDPKPPAVVGLAGEQVVRTLDRLCRRVWLLWTLNVLVRGAWLGGLVGIGWLILERMGGPDFDADRLLRIGAVSFGLGLVFATLIRPSRARTAAMLDRSFRLHERMTTAIENLGRGVPPPGVRAEVVYLQMADAANVVAELRRHSAFGFRLPLRELVLALACALLLAACFFLRGVGGGIPDVVAGGIPPFTPAANRPRPEQSSANPASLPPGESQAPTTAEVQARAARSNEAQRDLTALGQALDDHSSTLQAADAISRGDYDEAAQELRDLAANADDISEEAREDLADDLDAAADRMSEGGSDLAEATRGAADGLREGGEPAQDGLEGLGDAVQETGEEVVPQQELSDQMAAARASSSQSQGGEQGEDGEQQASESGDSGDRRSSGEQAEGSQTSGETGQPGEEGSEAQPGESGESSEAEADRGSNPGRSQNQGQGEQRGRTGRSAAAGEATNPRAGAGQPGEAGAENPGEGQPGENPSDSASAQDGAGAGDSESADGTEGGRPAGENGAAEGQPAEERVTTAQPPEGAEPGGDPRETDDAIRLDDSGGAGIQTGEDQGSASLGSGTGTTAAGGDATQQEVGESGPDSNRVPPEHRDVVEEYFSDPGQGG